jgi:uncharacterized membrane protein
MKSHRWLVYALLTTAFWGVWGAFTGKPAENGFPETLTYCVWAVTMIPPAAYALARTGWQLQCDARSMLLGLAIGFLGAGGQMLLFHAVRVGPPYLIFPVIALSPIVTIVLSLLFLKERVRLQGAIGIAVALIALPMFDYAGGGVAPDAGLLWFIYAVCILFAWGVQAYFMKLANHTMSAESIFFYMTITGLLLTPIAFAMTDIAQPINTGIDGPYLAFIIQILNSIGALMLVYAFRYGRAIVVSPLANAGAPLITALISMAVLHVVPQSLKLLGIALAFVAAILLAIEPEETAAC